MLIAVVGLENCPFSEFLAFDRTYLERTRIRQSVMDQYPLQTYDCDPLCEAAVTEMYEWMFRTYLPKRLPALFKVMEGDEKLPDASGDYLYNSVTNEYIPLRAPPAKQALYTLGKNVDDDILILLPLSTADDGSPIYHLAAYVCCFPSGFSLPEKFGLPLVGV